MKKPFSFEEFKSIYSRVPRLSVDVVIKMDGGIVLVERALESYKGQWQLPGGTLYFKEKVVDAAKRLAKEETGLLVEPKDVLGYIEYHSEEKERGFGYTIGLVLSCELVGGKIHLNNEGSELKTFAVLPQNMVIDQKQFLESLGYRS